MSNVQTLPDPEETPETLLARYKEEIKYYEKESGAWDERARKILRRYKDERSPREQKIPRFNILYSNIQTLLPAIYGKNPKADIERRFKDKDPLGRVTSDVLERCVDFFTNTEQFRSSLRNALFDRLTAGRGTVWTRYVPHFKDMQIESDNEEENDLGAEVGNDVEELAQSDEVIEEVTHEDADTDYVYWADLGHNWSRTWDEIYIIWRKVYMSRKELTKRFGEDISKKIPLDYFPKGLNDQKKETTIKKAVVYECWDKEAEKVRWLHKDCEEFLDEKDDPLQLPDFFPCPKPLYAVLANDSMIPVPDYIEYQDQAFELDELTSRIAAMTKAVKVAGVYDASAAGVERLLAEGVENKMVAVEQWAVHAEKGGLKGVMDFLPVEDIMKTLLGLYEARDKVKGDLYEITGIADIIRGNGDPNETATGVNAKGKFATLRLSDSQDDMARFARDAVKNVACIIANHFSMDTIKKISGVKLLTAQEKQHIQMQMQQQAMMAQHQAMLAQAQKQQQNGAGASPGMPASPPQQPQPPAPPPLSPEIQELLEDPTWEEVEQLLRDQPELTFKIDIEIDSTIKMDDDAQKEEAVEFLKATGEFLSSMQQAPPIAQPLLAEMLMFGVRRFRVGKELESQFAIFAEKLEKQASAAPSTPPNPEMIKVQADIQAQQARAQADKEDAQNDMQMKMATQKQEMQLKMQEQQQASALKEKELLMTFNFKMKEMQAKLAAEQQVNKAKMDAEKADKPLQRQHEIDMVDATTPQAKEAKIQKVMEPVNNLGKQVAAHEKAIQGVAKSISDLHEHIKKPKTISMKARDGRMLTATVQ